MGRDISVVSKHSLSKNPFVRAIVSAESLGCVGIGDVKFSLKDDKVFLFDRDTGDRILF